jgi:membrane protease YdiL (CAAX protease family)
VAALTGDARRDPAAIAVAVGSLAALAAVAVLGPDTPRWAHAAASIVAVALTLVPVHAAARSLAVLAAALTCMFPLAFAGLPWQAIMLVGLAVWGVAVRCVPALAPSSGWRARGRVPGLATVLVAGVTPFALVSWLLVARPDLSDVIGAYVPDLPLAALVVGSVGFAVVNAVGEELIWRGVVQDRLALLVGVRAAVGLQALSFGLQQAHGIPRGTVGALLAGVWAVMLGALRTRSEGLLAPLIAHIVADAVIATIVLTMAAG